MSPYWAKATKYKRLEETESVPDITDKDDAHTDNCLCSTITWQGIIPHLSISFLAGFFLAAVILWGPHLLSASNSYEFGFATEIGTLRPAIALVETRFSGTLRYKEKDHLYIDLGPNGVRYFGVPSPEVDEAWNELIGDHEGAFPADILGPDVLHSLHCLNEVRKVLDSQYYYNGTLEFLNRGRHIHIDHCLNHIRQVIQCHMDLTPVRTVYFEDVNAEVGDFDQVHMCRDFGKLRRWMNKRHVTLKTSPQQVEDGKVHRLGYPDNEEAMAPWDDRVREFD